MVFAAVGEEHTGYIECWKISSDTATLKWRTLLSNEAWRIYSVHVTPYRVYAIGLWGIMYELEPPEKDTTSKCTVS
jgi:hypothetical protein